MNGMSSAGFSPSCHPRDSFVSMNRSRDVTVGWLCERLSHSHACPAARCKAWHPALHNYHDVHKSFPIGTRHDPGGGWGPSWMVGILPQIEQGPLFEQFDLSVENSGFTANAAAAGDKVISTYVCPSSSNP